MTAKGNPGTVEPVRGAEDHDASASLAPNSQPVKPAVAAAEMHDHKLGIITMMPATLKSHLAPEPEEDLRPARRHCRTGRAYLDCQTNQRF